MLKIGYDGPDPGNYTISEYCFSWAKISMLSRTKLEKCQPKLFFHLELSNFITKLLNITLFEFVQADGTSSKPSGRGLMDLVQKKEINMTVPRVTFDYKRYQLAQFSVPTIYGDSECFLICGTEHLERIAHEGIITKLVGTKNELVYMVAIVFLLLSIGRWIEQRGGMWKAVVDTLLCRAKDKSRIGVTHARLFTALLVLVVLKGFFKLGLIKNFTPVRKFPFNSIQRMANGIESGEWNLAFSSRTNLNYELLTKSEDYKSLRDAYVARGTSLEAAAAVTMPEDMKPHEIFFKSGLSMNDFMQSHKDRDCMCESFGLTSMDRSGAVAMNLDNVEFEKNVTLALLTVMETGNLLMLEKKYNRKSGTHFDSKRLDENFKVARPPWVSVKFAVLRATFERYLMALAGAIAVFCIECLFHYRKRSVYVF